MASEAASPAVFDDDNPEWTEEDFARARPADEVLPPEVLAAFAKGVRAKPVPDDTEEVSLRLDRDVIARFKADGAGWQSRMNAALRAAAGL